MKLKTICLKEQTICTMLISWRTTVYFNTYVLVLMCTHYRAQYSQTSVSYSTSKRSDAYCLVHKNTVLYENMIGQLLMDQ